MSGEISQTSQLEDFCLNYIAIEPPHEKNQIYEANLMPKTAGWGLIALIAYVGIASRVGKILKHNGDNYTYPINQQDNNSQE